MAPTVVSFVVIPSMYLAVCSPGLMPGMNAPDFFQVISCFSWIEN
jgi:hypothetical protein